MSFIYIYLRYLIVGMRYIYLIPHIAFSDQLNSNTGHSIKISVDLVMQTRSLIQNQLSI